MPLGDGMEAVFTQVRRATAAVAIQRYFRASIARLSVSRAAMLARWYGNAGLVRDKRQARLVSCAAVVVDIAFVALAVGLTWGYSQAVAQVSVP